LIKLYKIEHRDTIQDVIITCARKPTRVSLIYHTEPTTKKCKTEKLKCKKQICSEVAVWGVHVVSPEEERKAAVGMICRKGSFYAWNERVRG